MLKLWRYLGPFALPIAGVLMLVFIQTMADLYLPTLQSEIIDRGVMRGDTAVILSIGGRMILVTGGSIFCAVLGSWLSANIAMGFGRAVRGDLFRRVESFSLHEFDRFGSATLITRTTNDVTQVQMVTMMIMRMMVMAPIMAVGGIVMAFSRDRPLTLTLAVALPVLGFLIFSIASRAMPLFKSIQKKIDRINLVLREDLTGIRVIRAFNRTRREEERFEAANADITETNIKVNRLMAFLMPTVMMIMNLTSLAILWFGVGRVDNGSMQLGSLIAFTQYAMLIMFSMLMMSMMLIMVPRAQAAAERIDEILSVEPSIKDPVRPLPLAGSGQRDAGSRAGIRADVEFRDVSFSYHGAEKPAVQGISFRAGRGEVTAIVGSTGSGKSTLAKLIPRFYDVDSGAVLVGGADVRELTQEGLRARIGYVPQKSYLFSGTIADNLRFGAEGASDEEVRAAAGIAQAEDFIGEFGDGYGHLIAQGGTNVSGGQKQRLSIARALARKPDIFIFDDSFSALDFKTDSRLRAAIRKNLRGATVLLIAQRIGTVMDADRIIVLDEGLLVGQGRHAELMATCPVYREIAASQLSEEELA